MFIQKCLSTRANKMNMYSLNVLSGAKVIQTPNLPQLESRNILSIYSLCFVSLPEDHSMIYIVCHARLSNSKHIWRNGYRSGYSYGIRLAPDYHGQSVLKALYIIYNTT